MAAEISVEALGRELRELLDRLPAGESVTLVGADGKPVARVIAIPPQQDQPTSGQDLLAEWEELAQEVSKDWKSQRTALEVLSEMRR